VFTGVDQKAGLTVAPNAGSVEDFAKRHEQHPTLVRQLRNKVRKCEGCGKPNAFSLANCNGCGRDLSTTDISFTNNVFVGFVYGIEKGAHFSLTYLAISFLSRVRMRWCVCVCVTPWQRVHSHVIWYNAWRRSVPVDDVAEA
jgi:hypothetical protein